MFFYTPLDIELGTQDVPLPQDITDLVAVDTVNQAFQMLANGIFYNQSRMEEKILLYDFTADATPDLSAALTSGLVVWLLMIGGGGAGGSVNPIATRGGGGGGGAGAIVSQWFTAGLFPTNPIITIGQGGVSGGSINGTATSLTAAGELSISASPGLGGSTATTSDGAFGGDGGAAFNTAPAQGQGGAGSSSATAGSAGGDVNMFLRRAGGGGGGGGSSISAGGAGANSSMGYLAGAGGALGNPGDAGLGRGAGGGGAGRPDGGGGGGGGGGLGTNLIATPGTAVELGGDGANGIVRIVIFRGDIGTP